MVQAMMDILKWARCKHNSYRFIGAVNVYVDLWGYDHTMFTFECIECGKKKRIKTRNPDVVWESLCEYWR